jgi:hypothetical protein
MGFGISPNPIFLLIRVDPRLSAVRLSASPDPLEPPDDAAGIAEVVLVGAGAGGKAGQRAECVEICANVIYLRCANGEVLAQSDIDAAAKSHGERVGAIQRSREPAQDRHADACAEVGERHAEQRVSKDRALAEIARDSGAKQHVIHVLLRAGGKAESGNAGQLFGVAAEVGGEAEVAGEVEGALAFPSTKTSAEVEIAASDAGAAEIIAGMKQGVSPENGPACCYLAGLLLGKAQHGKTQNG